MSLFMTYVLVTVTVQVLGQNFYADFFPTVQQPLAGQGLPIIDASPSRSGTGYSVGLSWTTDWSNTETSS